MARPFPWSIQVLIILPRPDFKFLFAKPAHFVALGFGAGLVPRAPGTFGTLVAYPLWWLLIPIAPALAWCLVGAGFLLGIWVCALAGTALGVSDHGAIVWDEIVAMLAVLLLTPPGLVWAVAAFALFRIFDIWKPFPIDYIDRKVKGGLGVMLDDVLAAVYAVAVMRIVEQFINSGLS